MSRAALLAALAALTVLSGCGISRFNPFTPRGAPEAPLPYKATLTRSDNDPRAFVVSAEAAGVALAQARESLRHPATAFCLLNYGSSDVAWQRTAGGDWATARQGRALMVRGRCQTR